MYKRGKRVWLVLLWGQDKQSKINRTDKQTTNLYTKNKRHLGISISKNNCKIYLWCFFFFFFHFFFIRYGISSWLISSVASPVTQASIVTSCPPTPCHLSRTPARSKAARETILDGGVFSLTVYPWVYCYFLCAPRYLDSVRPLLTPEEYKETEAVST